MQRACGIMQHTLGIHVTKEPEEDRRSSIDKDISALLVSCLVANDIGEFATKKGRQVLEALRNLDKLPGGPVATLGKW